MILWSPSAIQYDKDQLLPDGLCRCTQGAPAYRRENISGCRQRQPLHVAAGQGFSPIFTSPFCLLPPLSIANSGLLIFSSISFCVAQSKLAVPVSLRHCSFLPPSRAQTAFPVASHVCYSFAWKGCMEQCWQGWGSFCNGDLGTDLRHRSCWGKSQTQVV